MNIKKLALAGAALTAVAAAGTVAHAKVVDKPKFKVGGLVLVWGGTDANADATVVSDFYLLGTSGTAGSDLIGGTDNDVNGGAGDAVVTGSFDVVGTNGTTNPAADGVVDETGGTEAGVLDAGDSLNAFAVDANTDLDGLMGPANGKFYVASNTAFEIRAVASETTSTTDALDLSNIAFEIATATSGNTAPTGGFAFGGNAQDPCTTTGGCFVTTIDSLDDMATEASVYTADRRTAASRGSIAAQSVRFDTTYTFDSDTATAGIQGYDLSDGVVDLEAEVVYTVYAP